MFQGSIVAIVTPFKNGKVDEEAYRALIEDQIQGGTGAIVPCGTTGESATLSVEEHNRVIDIAIEAVNKRVPVTSRARKVFTGTSRLSRMQLPCPWYFITYREGHVSTCFLKLWRAWQICLKLLQSRKHQVTLPR